VRRIHLSVFVSLSPVAFADMTDDFSGHTYDESIGLEEASDADVNRRPNRAFKRIRLRVFRPSRGDSVIKPLF
jgi:hypothetical protein